MTACDEVASLLALEGVVIGSPSLGPELFDPEERASLAEHLAGCAACSARSAEFAGAVATLAAPAAELAPSAAGFAAVLARLEAGEDPAKQDGVDGKAKTLPGDEGALPAPVVRLQIALSCTYCHDGLLRSEATYCASCLAPHHEECVRAHGRCAAPGCEETRVVRPLDVAPSGTLTRSGRPRRGRIVAFALGGLVVAALGVAALGSLPSEPPTGEPGAVAAPGPARGQVLVDPAALGSSAHALIERAERLLADGGGHERTLRGLAEAEAGLELALRLDPANPRIYFLLAQLHARQGDLRGAIASLDRALELDPRSAEAYRARAQLRKALGEGDAAAVDMLRAEELGARVRVVQGEVVEVEGRDRVVVRGPGGPDGLRVGDALAVRRGGQIAVRLNVVELLLVQQRRGTEEGDPTPPSGTALVRCTAESLVAGAAPGKLDVAVLVTDEAVWTRARDRARREQTLLAIERRREAGGIRVLYLEATAGRSWATTRDALLRSRSIDAHTWLVTDDPTYVQRSSQDVTPLTAPPTSFGDYDVLVVGGSVPAALLPPEAVARFLGRGGGLVLLPSAEGGFASLPGVARSLPLDGGAPDGRQSVRPTFRAGLTNVHRLLGHENGQLPPFPPLLGVLAGSAKRGAQVLAQDEAGRPLVALARVADGDGRVVQIGADDLWRWETMEGGEAVLQLFWLEVVAAASGEVWSAEGGAR